MRKKNKLIFSFIFFFISGTFLIIPSSEKFLICRRIKNPIDLTKLSDTEKKEYLEKRIVGKDIPTDLWERTWVEEENAAEHPRINYLIWLKNVGRVTSIVNRVQKIFYPGIGPGPSGIDLISSFFAFPNAEEIFALGLKTEINTLKLFQKTKERRIKIYFGKDAHDFFPPELEKGYDALYTRWTFKGREDKWLNPLKNERARETREKWIKFMHKDTGFIVLDTKGEGGRPYFDEEDNFFWDNFFEIDFKEITTAVIADYRVAHLLVRKNNP
ncbi:MAG: hypothetical protein NC920_00535 [Candidatus Omnitrophica bacterium]|nr:hypothetical protein [Candidatus Omnitrophota bacterium]MCM8798046.1 hypothetical protein [Candidatus Omnitrophota bacterium]